MNFTDLKDFIINKMRMSHIYQPVMLKTLLSNKGTASVEQIAQDILSNDESQVDYYESITKNMVGKVLRNRDIVSKDKDTFSLKDFGSLTAEQTDELTKLCNNKLEEYIQKRGEQIWEHRKKSSGYISGTLKYEVLKRAEQHCELCGISNHEKALEVDHIIPRNQGGEDDISNLQALCYSCNSMKRDRDDTDFRKVRESYKSKVGDCIFCNPPSEVVMENNLAYAIRDKFPITEIHTLIIPKRHTEDYFSLSRPEINACNELISILKDDIESADETVKGFNIGSNNGDVAGQTIFHCHIHVIPRREDDVINATGGVRNIIPSKGDYIKN